MTPDDVLEFAEGLARVAASGGGPTALAGHLAKITGLGVMLEDAQWRTLVTTGPGTFPATARGLDDDTATIFPVRAGSEPTGWLTLFGGHSQRATFGAAARLTASAIAVELARDGTGAMAKKRAFWDGLVTGAYFDLGSARADAASRGILLADAYVCVALDAENIDDLRALAASGLRPAHGELATLESGGALLVLVPAPREIDAENARTAAHLLPKHAEKKFAQVTFSGGVSGAVAPLELPKAVREATSALAIAKRLFGEGRVVTHAELGAYPLIYSGAGVGELREFATRTLASLRAYDDKHQTELEKTLRCYFANGMNVKDAAAGLNVHRHTVFYRLRQIAEISGTSLESEHDQLTLRLAIAIDALHT